MKKFLSLLCVLFLSLLTGADDKPKGAKEGAGEFAYPGAKLFDEDREGARIYHARYTTTDKPGKVVEWYRGKAKLVEGVEGIGFARNQEAGEASSVLPDSRAPGKDEHHRGEPRPVEVVSLTKKTRAYVLSVVVSRAKDEAATHIALTYLRLDEK
jgi:hypothetical protein